MWKVEFVHDLQGAVDAPACTVETYGGNICSVSSLDPMSLTPDRKFQNRFQQSPSKTSCTVELAISGDMSFAVLRASVASHAKVMRTAKTTSPIADQGKKRAGKTFYM